VSIKSENLFNFIFFLALEKVFDVSLQCFHESSILDKCGGEKSLNMLVVRH